MKFKTNIYYRNNEEGMNGEAPHTIEGTGRTEALIQLLFWAEYYSEKPTVIRHITLEDEKGAYEYFSSVEELRGTLLSAQTEDANKAIVEVQESGLFTEGVKSPERLTEKEHESVSETQIVTVRQLEGREVAIGFSRYRQGRRKVWQRVFRILYENAVENEGVIWNF